MALIALLVTRSVWVGGAAVLLLVPGAAMLYQVGEIAPAMNSSPEDMLRQRCSPTRPLFAQRARVAISNAVPRQPSVSEATINR